MDGSQPRYPCTINGPRRLSGGQCHITEPNEKIVGYGGSVPEYETSMRSEVRYTVRSHHPGNRGGIIHSRTSEGPPSLKYKLKTEESK